MQVQVQGSSVLTLHCHPLKHCLLCHYIPNWTPRVTQMLTTSPEYCIPNTNFQLPHSKQTVGHRSREQSRIICEVTGRSQRTITPGKGLEVPFQYIFKSKSAHSSSWLQSQQTVSWFITAAVTAGYLTNELATTSHYTTNMGRPSTGSIPQYSSGQRVRKLDSDYFSQVSCYAMVYEDSCLQG